MGFVSVVLGILGIFMLSTCAIGGLCPRLLKDHKTGKIPKRNDMVLGGLILGLPLLGGAWYLAPSGLVEYFLLWAASIGLGCALIYGGFNAAKNVKGLPEQANAAHAPLITQEIVVVAKEISTSDEISVPTEPAMSSDPIVSGQATPSPEIVAPGTAESLPLSVSPPHQTGAMKKGLRSSVGGVDYHHPLGQAIAPVLRMNDWDSARRYLQKIAYGITRAKQSEQDEFTRFMAGFAMKDPLYRRCLMEIRPVLKRNPEGIRQTELYRHMSYAPDVEMARYVLYYADVLGDIVRLKKGSSYMIFPGGTVVPTAAPKTTGRRKRKRAA